MFEVLPKYDEAVNTCASLFLITIFLTTTIEISPEEVKSI